MEWQQIEYFQVVATMQHMSRAAEVLSISQPALSRSISRLEDELGVPLFDRQKRSIILNQYGKLFLSRANKIIQELQDGKQEIQGLLDPEYGNISLGFLHTLGTHIIPDLIGSFRKKYPKIKFQLNQNNSQLIVKQLESGEIDLGFTTYRETKLQVKWFKLWNEELFAIVSKGHYLANYKSITLNQIADESFISFKEGYVLRTITDQLCKEAGFTPKILFEGEEVSTISGLVAAGLGVAIIPNPKGLDRSKISIISVKSPKCQRIIKMAWVEGRYLSPAVKLFRQFIMDYFKSKSVIPKVNDDNK
jgi:DNA-binding transcriptional LysR family regulator